MRWLYMQKGIETQRKIDSRRQKSRAINLYRTANPFT